MTVTGVMVMMVSWSASGEEYKTIQTSGQKSYTVSESAASLSN